MKNLKWEGDLTVENVDEVADRVRALLTDRRYTFVASNGLFDFKPEARTGQVLKEGKPSESVQVCRHSDTHVQVLVGDTYGVWSFFVSGRYEDELEEDFVKRMARDQVSLWFYEDQMVVRHRAGAGHLLFWTIAVEDDKPRDTTWPDREGYPEGYNPNWYGIVEEKDLEPVALLVDVALGKAGYALAMTKGGAGGRPEVVTGRRKCRVSVKDGAVVDDAVGDWKIEVGDYVSFKWSSIVIQKAAFHAAHNKAFVAVGQEDYDVVIERFIDEFDGVAFVVAVRESDGR